MLTFGKNLYLVQKIVFTVGKAKKDTCVGELELCPCVWTKPGKQQQQGGGYGIPPPTAVIQRICERFPVRREDFQSDKSALICRGETTRLRIDQMLRNRADRWTIQIGEPCGTLTLAKVHDKLRKQTGSYNEKRAFFVKYGYETLPGHEVRLLMLSPSGEIVDGNQRYIRLATRLTKRRPYDSLSKIEEVKDLEPIEGDVELIGDAGCLSARKLFAEKAEPQSEKKIKRLSN